MEDLQIEKQKLQDKYDRDTSRLEADAKTLEQRLTSQHSLAVTELTRQHKADMEALRKELEQKYVTMKQVATSFDCTCIVGVIFFYLLSKAFCNLLLVWVALQQQPG